MPNIYILNFTNNTVLQYSVDNLDSEAFQSSVPVPGACVYTDVLNQLDTPDT